MSTLHKIRTWFRRFGIDVCRFEPSTHHIARRRKLMTLHSIDTVLDVGANAGQYGRQLRDEVQYGGRIVSFEPMEQPFKLLNARAKLDGNWDALNIGLGEEESTTFINVAGNSYSSSLLEMEAVHVEAAPESRYVGREQISIKKLDSVFKSAAKGSRGVYLKIDTQGYEARVLRGAAQSLNEIRMVQVEMSLRPLYQGEPTIEEMILLLKSSNYRLVSLEEGFCDPSSAAQLQVDGIFLRE